MKTRPREFVSQYGLQNPRGAYSVAPVFSRSILDLPFHVDRLYSSCLLLGAEEGEDYDSFARNLMREARASMRLDVVDSGLLTLCAGRDEATGTWRLSALFTSMEKNDLLCAGLPPFLTVDVGVYSRKIPQAKAATWPKLRMPLEERRNRDAAETILVSAEGILLEGLTSNFLAMRGSVLHVAPRDRVLCGSMSDLVLGVARSLGIETTEEAPATITEMEQFDAAFLTSATKPIAPIRRVITSTGEVIREFPTEKLPSMLQLLQTTVRRGLAQKKELLPTRSMWTLVDDI